MGRWQARVMLMAGMWAVTAGAGELDLLPLGDEGRSLVISSAVEGSLYDCRQGRDLEIDELARALVEARVVLVGEDHTDARQKRFHAELLDAMAQIKSELVLGMEFFLRSDDELLADWSAGRLDDDELLRRVGWYDRGSYRFEYYREVMHVARARGIPVVGLNVAREIPRRVNRGGLASLADDELREVGEVTTDGSPQHRYLISRYFGETVAMMPAQWLDNMYAAQCLWDVVMARSILDRLAPRATMVVIVGSGHVAYDLGIARRIHDELARTGRPDMRVATFCPVIAPAPDPEGDPQGHPMGGHGDGTEPPAARPARFVGSLADYVGVFPDSGGVEDYPRLGLQLADDEGPAPVVGMVWPDTLAESAGFEHGDRVVDVNGTVPNDASDLRMLLATIEWGQRIGLMVDSGGERLERAVLPYPRVDTTETRIAPGWEVSPAVSAAVDPRVPVEAGDGGEDDERTVLVSRSGEARVEVRDGDLLAAVHELDPAGYVTRSLFREPLPDGTVEIVYRRADGGAIVDSLRRDRTGAPVDGAAVPPS